MRRTDEEFGAEVYRRGDTYLRKRRKLRKRLITVGTIVLLCAVVLVPVILSGNVPLMKSDDKVNDSILPESADDLMSNSGGMQNDFLDNTADTEGAKKPTTEVSGSVTDEMDEGQSLYIVSVTVNKSALLQVTYTTGGEEGQRLFADAIEECLKQEGDKELLPETDSEDLSGVALFSEATEGPCVTYGGSSFVIQMRDEVTEEQVHIELYANGLWLIPKQGTKPGGWISLKTSEAEMLREYLVMWMSGAEQ